MNPKGHASSSFGAKPSKIVRKFNEVISLRSGRDIDNQVKIPKNPANTLTICFRILLSPPFFSRTGSSSKFGDATADVPGESSNPVPSYSPSDKEELKEKNSADLLDPSSPKNSPLASSIDRVNKYVPPFPHRMRRSSC